MKEQHFIPGRGNSRCKRLVTRWRSQGSSRGWNSREKGEVWLRYGERGQEGPDTPGLGGYFKDLYFLPRTTEGFK